MVLEKKANKIDYVRYTKDRTNLERRISFKRPLAEETNKIIAVFNNESEVLKLNNSLLTAISYNCFIKQLEKLTEEEIIFFLEKEALREGAKTFDKLQTRLQI